MSRTTEQLRDRASNLERMPMVLGAIGDGGGSGEIVPCKLTAKTNDTTYTGDLYANGSDTTASETGVTIKVRGLATGSSLPFATWFDSQQQPWTTGTFWTLVGVPRWV